MERKCEFCSTQIEYMTKEGYPNLFFQNGCSVASKWVCKDCATKLVCDKCGKPVKVILEKKNIFSNDDTLSQIIAEYIDCTEVNENSPVWHNILVCDECIHELKCNFCEEPLKPHTWRHGIEGKPIGPKWICKSCAEDLSKALEEPSEDYLKRQFTKILRDV